MNLEDIKTLRLLLSQLDERVDLIEGEAAEVADLVLEFNLAKNDMGIVYDRLVNLLGDLMIEDPIIELRDGAQVERKVASSRKGWQHKDLAGVVMDRIVQSSVDMDTGEVISTPKDMANLFALHAERPLQVPIDRTLDLAQADDAQRAVLAGGLRGRIVLLTSVQEERT